MQKNQPDPEHEFDLEEGLALALSYLDDPSDVPCPRCGPGLIEVVCYLDSRDMEEGETTSTIPECDYTAILYCHGCRRAAALDLSREGTDKDRKAT